MKEYKYENNLLSDGTNGAYLVPLVIGKHGVDWIPVIIPFDFAYAERN